MAFRDQFQVNPMELGSFHRGEAFWLARPKDYATSQFWDERKEQEYEN